MTRPLSGFCFITDRKASRLGLFQDVSDAIAGGASMVQYRDKGARLQGMLIVAQKLLSITKPAGVPLIINDEFSVALQVGADGCHLGQSDFPLHEARRMMAGKIVGLTVHNAEEARRAEQGGANYIGASPIFPTGTKADAGKSIGLEGLREIRKATRLPIFAIGGITLQNAPSAIEAGADGLCAISAASGLGVEGKVASFAALFPKTKKHNPI
jgi:thiamine-phosphate pyrophosphorylase